MPRRARITVLTVLATGLVLLLCPFIRESLGKSEGDPDALATLARIGPGLRCVYAGK